VAQCWRPAAEQGVGGFDVGQRQRVADSKISEYRLGWREMRIEPEQRAAAIEPLDQ